MATDFWNYVYDLQQQGTLCDMQLCISDSPAVLPVHRLVLLASSTYYQTSLLEGDLQDTYYFNGLKEENLQLLVDYCYRQISWSELTKSAEAAMAAQTLQLVQHPESESTLQGTDNCEYPEMVVVQIDSTGNEIKQQDKKSEPIRDYIVQRENKCTMTDVSYQDDQFVCETTTTEIRESVVNETKKAESTSAEKEDLGDFLKNGHNYKTRKRRKMLVTPSKHDRPSVNANKHDPDVKVKPDQTENIKKSDSTSNKFHEVPTTQIPATPERSSSRKRKISSKYADYEDVPTFTPTKRHVSQEAVISTDHKSATTGKRKTTKPKTKATNFEIMENAEGNAEVNEAHTESLLNKGKHEVLHTVSSSDDNVTEVFIGDHCDSQEIPIVITLEPGKHISLEEGTCVVDNEEEKGDPNVRADELSNQRKKYVKQEYPVNIVNPVCEICGGSFKSLTTCISHEKRDHKHHRNLSCTICSKSFKEKRQLIRHLTEVHNNNTYSCNECGAQFKSREGLVLHRKKKHITDSLSVECDECEKKFFALAQLKSHKLFKHSSERNESCDSCHRTFKTKSLLKRHKSTFHSSERKHMCDLCGSMFKTVNDMKMHRKKHYKEDGTFVPEIIPRSKLMYPPGDYQCRFCGKVFSKYHVRETHERTVHVEKSQGNLFICTICNKSFPIKQSLMNHIKNKHLPRRYECSACHVKFVTHRELVRHVENPERCRGGLQETQKPFWCNECQKGFTLKGNLTKHLQRGLCLRNKKVTTNYVVVLQKTGETGDANSGANQKLEKIIALEEGFEKVQDIVEAYKENSMIEVELLNEETVENLDDQVADTVEVIEQHLVGNIGELEGGQEIILQQQEDGTMIIPYTINDGQTTVQTLNLDELQQAAQDGGGNLEILLPEGTNIDDLATAMGGSVEIHVAEDSVVLPEGEIAESDSVSTGVIQGGVLLQTDGTEPHNIVQGSYDLVCTEAEVETDDAEN